MPGELLTLGLLALLGAALMGASHYIAPRIAGRELHRLEAYVVGVGLGILAPFCAWCLILLGQDAAPLSPLLAAGALVVIVAGAALGTAGAWWVDHRAGERVGDRMGAPDGKP